MKKLSLLLVLFVAYQVSLAQNITVSGMVTNEHGLPLRYAFVLDKQAKSATYTDSTGTFSLSANPPTQLIINCKVYTDATVDVGGQKSLQIILKTDATDTNTGATANPKSNEITVLENAFKTNSGYDVKATPGLLGALSDNTQDVVGSRFLFNKWVPGYIIKANGEILQSPLLLFNYDKMKGDLYFTEDLKTVLLADKNVVKGFILVSPQDQPLPFERMLGISDDLYSEVISAGSKYKIYKLITTKYIPSNYKSDGIYATGNKYDEYADDNSYFVANLTTLSFQPLILKKKSIMEAFAAEGDKINTFMAAHSSDKINEDYLKKLGDAMNQ